MSEPQLNEHPHRSKLNVRALREHRVGLFASCPWVSVGAARTANMAVDGFATYPRRTAAPTRAGRATQRAERWRVSASTPERALGTEPFGGETKRSARPLGQPRRRSDMTRRARGETAASGADRAALQERRGGAREG